LKAIICDQDNIAINLGATSQLLAQQSNRLE
jgi:hypothetical protein